MNQTNIVIRNASGILTGQRGALARRTGDVHIRDGLIAAIGAIAPQPDEITVDARGGVITPGLVCTHHHLFQTMLKGIPSAIDAPLETWLRLVPSTYWSRIDETALATAATVGMAELLLSGCTTVADHHYLFADTYRYDPAHVLFDTATRMGLRFVLARGGTTQSRKLDTDDIIPSPNEDLDTMLRRVSDLAARYNDPAPDAMRRVALAPNTPTWGMTPDELRVSSQAARDMGIGMHSHLSETTNYVTFCRERYGMSPVQFVAEHGWTGPDVWYAHLVHMDEAEIALLARTGTGMAHCPQSNCRLGSGIAPAPAMMRAGGRVSLAVDGAASNEACDMGAEMHVAWMVHRAVHGPAAVTCEDVIHWATAGGAQVLGLDGTGTVREGMAADLVVHGLDRPRHAGLHDPLIAPVASGAADVRHVFTAGRHVVVDGHIPGLDMPTLMARAADVVRGLDVMG
ncbi:MAG: amidohydrolase family protein [Komagataeibacter hansenii]|nr:amidohydrolase family protein [Novacetimonas hansenii]